MNGLSISLISLLENCQRVLLASTPTEVVYSDRENLANNLLPVSLQTSIVNVYALWVKDGDTPWVPMYIGQRQSVEGINRVKQHLFSTPSGTQSKLECVREALSNNCSIGVTALLVKPDSMRLAIEEELIFRNTNSCTDLPWNEKCRNTSLQKT